MDTKPWWQSKIIITQVVAVLFALLAANGVLPSGIDQAGVVTTIMTVGAIATAIFRVSTTHKIG